MHHSQNSSLPKKRPENFNLAVLGGGAWGTALASVAAMANPQKDILIYAREAEVVAAINEAHENSLFLPGYKLPKNVKATTKLEDLAHIGVILAVAPAQHMRVSLKALSTHHSDPCAVILCSKGIEAGTLCLMSDVAAQEMPQASYAVLSGPSFARDVVKGLPTAVTLACEDLELAHALLPLLAADLFRPYLADDLIGAEIGGSVKNVLAIACGMAEGRGLGESARAALITRGFAEMTRLGVAMGAKKETLAGLCGLGDLILTCSSTNSRNFSLGHALGKGLSLEEAFAGKSGGKLSVAEGAASAPGLEILAEKYGVDMPICAKVAAILSGKEDVQAAIGALLSRPLRQEMDQ